MPDNQIGPAFMIALGVAFAAYGSDQLAQAYRVEPFGEWMAKALPGAGFIVLGALFAWGGYCLLGSGVRLG